MHCCVTSPPYWGLRDYGVAGQLGLEQTMTEYLGKMVDVFREVRRVLRHDATLWLNIGDSYASTGGHTDSFSNDRRGGYNIGNRPEHNKRDFRVRPDALLKPKDLCGIPWRLAFALQADGWYLRSDIIWHKPNPMPESVADRPTKAHEYIFLLSKSKTYFYDADAIREPLRPKTFTTFGCERKSKGGGDLVAADNWSRDVPVRKPRLLKNEHTGDRRKVGFNDRWDSAEASGQIAGANKRTVWTVAPRPYKGAHFAVFPPQLIEPCILAGCPPGGTVLDPFFGSGTTGQVAAEQGKDCIGIELNREYVKLALERLEKVEGVPGSFL